MVHIYKREEAFLKLRKFVDVVQFLNQWRPLVVYQLKEMKTTCYDKKPNPDFIQKHTLFQWDAYIHICKYLLFIYTQGREK